MTGMDVPEIDTAALAAALDRDEVALVDVREQHEWDAGRIPGATHLPMSELGTRLGELDRSRPLVVQCRVGGRSAMVTAELRAAGIDATSLAGGILAWEAEGRPMAPDGGVVAEH